jgi:hypothetical protein
VLCLKCGIVISPQWPGQYHVGCYPDFEKMPGFDMTSHDLELREELIEIIAWGHRNAKRSQQVALGCSEVGHGCDLRLAYRMAGMPAVHNGGDPWPAIAGTSMHSWMEEVINLYQEAHAITDPKLQWFTEMEVHPSPLVAGHTDLYRAGLVLDWKFPSADNIKKMRAEGPSPQYITQVQLYGLGHVMAGRAVQRVGIVALGRQGWLKDMYVHTVEFDRAHADKALQRIYDLGSTMIELGLPEREVWDEIPKLPSRLCSWCPYWNRNASKPTSRGCPGK